jgi:hypothetical protein
MVVPVVQCRVSGAPVGVRGCSTSEGNHSKAGSASGTTTKTRLQGCVGMDSSIWGCMLL